MALWKQETKNLHGMTKRRGKYYGKIGGVHK